MLSKCLTKIFSGAFFKRQYCFMALKVVYIKPINQSEVVAWRCSVKEMLRKTS